MCQCANALITMRNTTAQQISKLTNQQIIKKEQEYAAIYLYTELCID